MTNKKIELVTLELTNFKGVAHFKLGANSSDVDVFGKNGAGKTTIYDAFTWCLFHKDSKDKEKFEWEPQGLEVDELQGTSIELTLNVNGKTRKFNKEINKKQNVKKNIVQKEPAYYVDDLKLKTKKEYDEKVAELIDKDTFKYLTNGNYFMETLNASERREILFKYFGTKTDEEIIITNKHLTPLLKVISEQPLDEANQKLIQIKQSLEKSIKEVTPQIKGIRKALPEISEIDVTALNGQKDELLIAIDKEEKDFLAIQNGSAIAEKRAELKVQESELQIAQLDYSAKQKAQTVTLEEKRSELLKEYYEVNHQLTDAEEEAFLVAKEIESNEDYIKRLNADISNYGKQLDDIEVAKLEYPDFREETFDEHQLSCPTCQRAYDLSDQEEMKVNFESEQQERMVQYQSDKQKALKDFMDQNDAEFARINQLGKQANDEIEQVTQKLNDLRVALKKKEDMSELETKLKNLQSEGESIKSQIESIEKGLVPFDQSIEFNTINEVTHAIEAEIKQLTAETSISADSNQEKINQLKNDVREIDERLSVVKEHTRQLEVIDQLIEEEKKMSADKGEIEAKLLLFEEFFVTKVNMLEENINQHFKFIHFKLFDYYDNGNLDESICEPVLDGVKYRDMSNGEQIKARIDICDTLMRAEGMYVPLFLDNAEGLTESFKTDTQVVALNASKEDQTLRINIQNNTKLEDVA